MCLKLILALAVLAAARPVRSSLSQESFAREALLAHNLYRRIHGVEQLKLNLKLCKLALNRSQELASAGHLAAKQNFYDGVNLGETLGFVSGFSEYNGFSATQFWYSVVNKYDEEGETSDEGKSFTQIVWKGTKEVGFGIERAPDGSFYFVAEYLPSGNIRGQYEMNVFQLTDELMRAPWAAKAATLKKANLSPNETPTTTEMSKTTRQVSNRIEPTQPTASILTVGPQSTTNELSTSRPVMRFTSYANKIWIPKNAGSIDLDLIRLNDSELPLKIRSGNEAEIIRDQPASLIFRLTTQNRPRPTLSTTTSGALAAAASLENESNQIGAPESVNFLDHLITETSKFYNSSVRQNENVTEIVETSHNRTRSTPSQQLTKTPRKIKKVRVHARGGGQVKKSMKRDEEQRLPSLELAKEDDNIDYEIMANEPDRMKKLKLVKRKFLSRL